MKRQGNIRDFWVCVTKRVGEREREHGRVLMLLLFFLVGGYMKDSLQGSIINFQEFHLQCSIQVCPFFYPFILTVPF